jgi:type IV conjugative transfer system protein TraL
MKDRNRIYKTLDNTPRMFFWEIDEFFLMIVPLFIGIMIGSLLLMPSGLFLKWLYCRLKRRYPRGIIKHKFYSALPTSFFVMLGIYKGLPQSHKRKFYT